MVIIIYVQVAPGKVNIASEERSSAEKAISRFKNNHEEYTIVKKQTRDNELEFDSKLEFEVR